MSPEQGRRLGPYEIQSRLGGGGMGYVYRAWDARLHREVAVKMLNHEYTMPGMRERFLREARAASGLNHPNICTVFDIGEQDGDPYLVMELLEGETLKDRIQGRTLQMDELVTIARETAEALGAAHAKGVIHRDVKPANIFLVNRGNGAPQAKVLDFGLAKIEGGALGIRSRSLDLTTAGSTVGTLAYMSPEQARGEVLDARSDLFSLGVVMYEMATRQVPFRGATSALVFVQLLNHPPEPVREWNESVSRELEKVILRLLAKERSARFQSAQELEIALLSLTEKGSAGWLKKAVSAVPLVRTPDPIARERRAAPVKSASFSAALSTAREGSPAPPEVPSRVGSDQFLRPVARVPRVDPIAIPGSRDTPNPQDGVSSKFLRTAASAPRRRAGDAPVASEIVTYPLSDSVSGLKLRPQDEGGPEQTQVLSGLSAAYIKSGVPERPPGAVFPWDAHDELFPGVMKRDTAQSARVMLRPLWLVVLGILLISLALLGVFLATDGRSTSRPVPPAGGGTVVSAG